MDLLDLPGHVLEEIFYQCINQSCPWESKNLVKLTECNKFLKDFIESSSRLMSHLYLKVDLELINEERNLDKFEDTLDACLLSSRQYRNIYVDYTEDLYITVSILYLISKSFFEY